MQSDLLTVFTVAQLLNRSPSTVRKYESQGKLKALRTSGGDRLFRRKDVERFAAQLTAQAQIETPRPAA